MDIKWNILLNILNKIINNPKVKILNYEYNSNFFFVIQIKYSNSFNCRFLYVSEPLTSVKKELESLFEARIEEGTPDESPERQCLQLFSVSHKFSSSGIKETVIYIAVIYFQFPPFWIPITH